MNAPYPDERVKEIRLMWTMKAEILVRDGQFTDAQGQPREPELLNEATLKELVRQRISDWIFDSDGDLIHDEGGTSEWTTDYELLNCAINGDITPC